MRSLKGGQPFLMMESTPGSANWHMASPQKERGLAKLSAMQAVAHGSRSVQYFQWRKSRGNYEKYHGAVVDHCGYENTRTFREVSEIGALLDSLGNLAEARVPAEVALLHDWEALYAITEDNGIFNELLHYKPAGYKRVFMPYYRALLECRAALDFVPPDGTWWEGKKLIVAPMWYLVREEDARRAEKFVDGGGTLVTTYWSGAVGPNGLCHLGGMPGPLRRLLGIWVEETSSMEDHRPLGARFGGGAEFEVRQFADSIHLEGAEALALFTSGIFAGQPAATSNRFGKGRAIHLGGRFPLGRLRPWFHGLLEELGVSRTVPFELPPGVYATRRMQEGSPVVFLMNFGESDVVFDSGGREFESLPDGRRVCGEIGMPGFGIRILRALD
jgi:beta-galactosidase